jgi:hypothetical protein
MTSSQLEECDRLILVEYEIRLTMYYMTSRLTLDIGGYGARQNIT